MRGLLKRFCKQNNYGFSMVELLIVIAIMAALVALITPQYIRYVYKSQKSTDMTNAERIGKAVNLALANDIEAHKIYNEWKPGGNKLNPTVSVTVGGVREDYKVYLLLSSETHGFFAGTDTTLGRRMSSGKTFYDVINDELGILYEEGGSRDASYVNEIMVPKYKVKGLDGIHKVDRWRICKRQDNGRIELWAAYDRGEGSGDAGGRPCYRVWPSPDDIYTQ